MSSPFYDLDGNPIPQSQILGMGRTGLVIRRSGDIAAKLPIRWSTTTDYEYEMNIQSLKRERDIYERIGNYRGFVPYLKYADPSLELSLMRNGDLRTYLSECPKPPSKPLQLSRFLEMARALAHIHSRRILVADIASRNFLLDSDLSIKFCDFTESSIFPLDECMDTANDAGYTIHTDIGMLGSVMYEVVTGERCAFDLYADAPNEGDAVYPQRENLPSTHEIWLGEVIEKCWTEGGFRDAGELLEELELLQVEGGFMEPSEGTPKVLPPLEKSTLAVTDMRRVLVGYISLYPISVMTMAIGTVGLLASWMSRRTGAS